VIVKTVLFQTSVQSWKKWKCKLAEVKFIYFEGCPNADKTRTALKTIGIDFDDVNQGDLPESSIFRNYSSPTILQGNNVIFGCETGQGRGGCSLEVPSIDELKNKLGTAVSSNKKNGFLSGIGSFGAALTVGLCPVCIPAIGAFLASIGLGFIVQESVLRPVLFIFLAAAISGLLWSYLKEHRNVWPLIGGILMGITLYVGRYVYLGSVINQVLMYGGIAGIIAVCIWNLKLRKSASCPACEVKEPA